MQILSSFGRSFRPRGAAPPFSTFKPYLFLFLMGAPVLNPRPPARRCQAASPLRFFGLLRRKSRLSHCYSSKAGEYGSAIHGRWSIFAKIAITNSGVTDRLGRRAAVNFDDNGQFALRQTTDSMPNNLHNLVGLSPVAGWSLKTVDVE